jgi:O-antigen ligase
MHLLLWLFVFTTPWDVVPLPIVGSLSRAFGLATLATMLLVTLLNGRIRRPDRVLLSAIAFGSWSAMSLLWTHGVNGTIASVFSYLQLIVLVAIVRESVKTPRQQEALFLAFVLGCFVPMAGLLYNFHSNVRLSMTDRFSAGQINADDLGLTLVVGLPLAWHVIRQRRGAPRAIAVVYFVLAPISTLLTGTRGAFLAGIVALSIVPLTMNTRVSVGSMARAAVLLAVVGVAMAFVVPATSWQRITSISTELLDGGRLTGRREIWSAGLQMLPAHPYIGFGAGAFGRATQNLLNTDRTTGHNFFLTMAVELGGIGLVLALFLLLAIASTIVRLPSRERTLWSIVMLTWLIGVMSVNWEVRKTTWLLFGFVAAHGSLEPARRRAATSVNQHSIAQRRHDPTRLSSEGWGRRVSLPSGWPSKSITEG